MIAHPLWGWAGLAILLIVSRPLAHWHLKSSETRQSRIWGKKVSDLSNHWSSEEARLVAQYSKRETELSLQWATKEAESAARWAAKEADLSTAERDKDLPLLNERLQGLELNGDFHTYLTEHVVHHHLPSHFVSTLEERLVQWRRDPRDFADPDIARAWGNCKAAATDYVDKINEYMWEKEGVDYLHVPPEWKHTDHQRYKDAFDELGHCRKAFSVALNEIYRIQHSKLASASQDLE